jgi:magnesium chelatase family protein
MKVKSYIRIGHELAPVEVELSLSPGLPQILFLGLPDTALKESTLRIRSAIREQGFQLPQAQQVLVHLRPTHLKKSSRGLDLAVAAALLWETGQVECPDLEGLAPTLYGELTLKGEVLRPDDTDEIEDGPVWTGPGPAMSVQVRELTHLKDLVSPSWIEAKDSATRVTRPACSVGTFPKPAAEVARVVAAGEHPALFAGPPGGGKSTLVDAIPSWLEEPREDELRLARKIARRVGREITWRPVAKPHHSITPLAMIGGGSSVWAGEISRAHGGVLIMDELLEFHPAIQEALREPMETGSISIVRGGAARTYPARCLLLGTANLCRCGKFVPGKDLNACRCPNAVRKRVVARLSGPFVDRFTMLVFTDEWRKSGFAVPVEEIFQGVQSAIEFRKKARGQLLPNAQIPSSEFEQSLTDFQRQHLLDDATLPSRRRRDAVIRVSRTLADLEGSVSIENRHLDQANRLCVYPHRLLEASLD